MESNEQKEGFAKKGDVPITSLHKNILTLGLMSLLAIGCSKVEQVKDGYLQYDSTTTIGKAFEASFANPTWNEYTTEKGQDFVEFTGDADIEFLELVAESIVEAAGDDIANPLSGETALHRCVDNEWANKYQSELSSTLIKATVASFGLIGLSGDLEEKIKTNLKTELVSKLISRPLKVKIQFDFDKSGYSNFELGYYGFAGQEWNGCEINDFIDSEDLLKFIYSNHTYSQFNYKKIASEIIETAESKGELPDKFFVEKTQEMSDLRKIVVLKEILSDNRVVKRMEIEKERKQTERKNNLNSAMKEILPVFRDYKSKFDLLDPDDNDFPRWNDVGFSAPESKFFEITDGSEPWGVLMQTLPEIVGVKCSFKLFCRPMFMDNGKCICRISDICEDIAPDLSSICNVEFQDYVF